MSIGEDKEFIKYFEKVLMAPYLFKEGLKNNEEIQKEIDELLDYIDDYVSLQIHLNEFPAVENPIRSHEELLECQKRLNAHLTKVTYLLSGGKENEH